MTEPADNPLGWIGEALDSLSVAGLRRTLRTRGGPQRVQVQVSGREVVHFGSNDYLGLAADERLTAAVAAALSNTGWGAGASPLITGHAELHRALEARLAEFTDCEAAIVFSSGYAANVGTIAALAGPEDVIYSDAKNHASIIDGCRLSRAQVHVYPHCDVGALHNLLRGTSSARRRLIVTDSVFSMDGDCAPLAELADLARQFGAMLMVDEAHATGVFGQQGRGWAEALGVSSGVHVHVGTLSKALGCAGGFVAGSRALIDWLINRARSYVFSTAHPAAGAAAALAALDIVRDEPGRRERLLQAAAGVRERMQRSGWHTGRSQSQIIPLYVGEPQQALRLAEQLLARGYWVPAIRPPSVPPGESLLRISLTAAHTPEMIDGLGTQLEELRR